MSLKRRANLESPHATYRSADGQWEYRVLKVYQTAAREKGNAYARWLVAARSPYTHGSWEMGDSYVEAVLAHTELVEASPEWDR